MTRLQVFAFTEETRLWPAVRGFDCGSLEWERPIGLWLNGSPDEASAIRDANDTSNRVLLFATEAGDVVGVGSIGPSRTTWPKPNGKLIPATCIPFLAVDVRHRNKGYGQQILDHLLALALGSANDPAVVVLYVHHENQSALQWYGRDRNGFKVHGKMTTQDGHPHYRMVVNLSGFARTST